MKKKSERLVVSSSHGNPKRLFKFHSLEQFLKTWLRSKLVPRPILRPLRTLSFSELRKFDH